MTNLFISILNWVQSFIGSYGWSVIVFTLLIKLVLLPLDVKSRRSMKAMSALNPKIEELKKLGREDIMVTAGGVIPAQDYDFLYKAGVACIFGPGTPIPYSAIQMM